MEIIGNIEIKGFLTCEDLNEGDVFTFLDENVPYMIGSNEYDNYIINLRHGYVKAEEWDSNIIDRPVRRLKAKLIIEN